MKDTLKNFRRFVRKETWVEIITKNNTKHIGTIRGVTSTEVKLDYSFTEMSTKGEKQVCYKEYIKISQIQSYKVLSCENSTVWHK